MKVEFRVGENRLEINLGDSWSEVRIQKEFESWCCQPKQLKLLMNAGIDPGLIYWEEIKPNFKYFRLQDESQITVTKVPNDYVEVFEKTMSMLADIKEVDEDVWHRAHNLVMPSEVAGI